MNIRSLIVSVALGVFASSTLADVKLPAIFADGMVIQQGSDASIWGWARPGEKITVNASWSTTPAGAKADGRGNWQVSLRTPPATEGKAPSETITIKGDNEITLKDVLIGDIWICSGQSNMEMPVGDYGGGYRGVANWQEELKHADHPTLRLFTVENTVSAEPLKDVKGKWAAASAESVKAFSATGYFFGVNVQNAVNIPIGLVDSDWGGTPAEAWTSEETLRTMREWAGQLDAIAKLKGDPEMKQRQYRDAHAAWLKKFDEVEPGSHGGWYSPQLNDSDWKTMDQPKVWDGDLANFDGTLWARREVEIPAEWTGRILKLELGAIDDCDATWFDGHKVGETMEDGQWGTPRVYTVPGEIVKAGRVIIAVRVLDNQGLGGMTGPADQMKLGLASGSGKPIPLSGPWKYKIGLEKSKLPDAPSLPALGPNHPTSLYNGMIAPLTPMAIRGAIWYQGESNRERAFQYRTLFPAMIKDWRSHFHSGEFPFYFVQIAPFGYGGDKGEAAELREAQMMTLSLPNTGMAVTMDIGNPADIHPNNKQDVGRRLALWAIAKTYGKTDVEYTGPVYKGMKVDGAKVRLSFEHAAGLSSGDKPLACFTIAGEDRKFVPAKAEIEGDSVIVSSDAVAKPVAVRFAWGAADQPNLKNKAGLPASSFRTDDWPGLTQPGKN